MAVYTLAEVAKHKDHENGGLWMVIHDKVYDVSKFMNEHPGGPEIIVENSGADSSEAFEDVGHSSDARELMKDFYIGELAESDKKANRNKPADENKVSMSWVVPVTVLLAAIVVYKIFIAKK